MLPTFLVIGAQKGGTSSLHAYLHQHPQVHMSSPKELDFFVAERNWDRGLAWYESHFDGAGPQVRAFGESSPLYTMWPSFPGVPERIAATLPGVRLVYLVRDPVARLRSHYVHALVEEGERRSLDAVARDDSGLIAFSLYAMQLERYLEHVPPEQLLVLPSEWLRDHRPATLRTVLSFVGADPAQLPPNLHEEAHRSGDKRLVRRGAGGVRRLTARLPQAAADPIDRLTSRPADAVDTTVPPALLDELQRQFREQLPLLRWLIGQARDRSPERLPPFDGWGLDT